MPSSKGGANDVCDIRVGFQGGEIFVKLVEGLVPKVGRFSLGTSQNVIYGFSRLKTTGTFIMGLMLPLFQFHPDTTCIADPFGQPSFLRLRDRLGTLVKGSPVNFPEVPWSKFILVNPVCSET